MAVLIPDMNPLRFRKVSEDPDWLTIWPNYRNITQRQEYFPGMDATAFYKDFITGRPISLQFQTSIAFIPKVISVYKYNNKLDSYQFYQDVTGEDITPEGWISGDQYKYTFTPSVEGVYKMRYIDAGIDSDEFVVHSRTVLKKQLVQVSFYNTANDYGMVFFDGITQNYTGLTYFTGNFQNFDPGNETSSYPNDTGGVEVLQSSPVHGGTLNLELLHNSYIENVNLIFSCDRISVNGVEYGRSDKPEVSGVEGSDLVNIKIRLIKRETSYYGTA